MAECDFKDGNCIFDLPTRIDDDDRSIEKLIEAHKEAMKMLEEKIVDNILNNNPSMRLLSLCYLYKLVAKSLGTKPKTIEQIMSEYAKQNTSKQAQ